MNRWPYVAVVSGALVSCATPRSLSGERHLAGWMVYRGEVMLFDNQRQAIDPTSRTRCVDGSCQSHVRCISGVFAGDTPPNLGAFDGRHVTVTGKVIDYRSLPDEQTTILPRKVLAGKIVSNFCLRDEVLLITSLTPI